MHDACRKKEGGRRGRKRLVCLLVYLGSAWKQFPSFFPEDENQDTNMLL